MPRIKKIMRMFGAQTYGTLINTLDKLATVPLFFYFWGAELYGEWIILRAIPAYLAVAELGFATAAANKMSVLVIENNKSDAQKYFNAAFLIITFFSIAIMFAVISYFLLVDVRSVFNFSSTHTYNLLLVIIYLLGYTLLIFQTQLISAAYRSVGEYVFAAYFTYHIRAVELVAVILALCSGGGVLIIAFVYLIVRLLGCLLMSWILLRKEKWLNYKVDLNNLKLVSAMLPNALGFLSFPIGQAMSLQGALFVIANVFSPSVVALFSTLRTLTRTVVQFGMQINRSVWPEMTDLYANGHIIGAKKLYLDSTAIYIWLSIFLCALLFIITPYFFNVWTANKVILDEVLFILLLIAAVINGYWYSALSVLAANDNHKKAAFVYVLANIFFVPAAYFSAHKYNVIGVAYAILVTDLLMLLIVMKYSLRQVGSSAFEFFLHITSKPYKYYQSIKRK